MQCNDVACRFKIFCGEQLIKDYCPDSCGGSSSGGERPPYGGGGKPQCRDENQAQCQAWARQQRGFYADCNSPTTYKFSSGIKTLKAYCGCTCDRTTLAEMGVMPRLMEHTSLDETETEPVKMTMIHPGDKHMESNNMGEDAWEEVSMYSYPEAVEEGAAAAHVSQAEEWIAFRTRKANWQCVHRGPVAQASAQSLKTSRSEKEGDPLWGENVLVAIVKAESGELLRTYNKFVTKGADNFKVILAPGEQCRLPGYS